ncbi:MAG TPA: hypothetical protein VEZ13_12040 [Brevibacillus sp.]|nr:hypothetical protein [Brevibacillus sp.]
MSKKITIAKLLENKSKLKNKKAKRQTLFIASLDGEIVIQEPEKSVALEALEMAQDSERENKADPYLVYHCVVEPNLKDPTLQQEFGCSEPFDIVDMIFQPGEVAAIGGFALKLAGFATGVKAVDDEIKN